MSRVRYVGQSKDPGNRFEGHLRDSDKTHKVHWIQSLLTNGKMPVLGILEVIENCSDVEWRIAERKWIAILANAGHRLTNADPGGIGRGTMSDETRKRISRKNKGRRHSKETIERYFLGVYPSEDSRKKMSESQRRRFSMAGSVTKKMLNGLKKGWSRVVTDEERRKISIAQKLRPRSKSEIDRLIYMARNKSQETRMKISLSNKGKTVSEETRRKLSMALKGRPVSQETRYKIKTTLKGHRVSAATRLKISKALKKDNHLCHICGEFVEQFPSWDRHRWACRTCWNDYNRNKKRLKRENEKKAMPTRSNAGGLMKMKTRSEDS